MTLLVMVLPVRVLVLVLLRLIGAAPPVDGGAGDQGCSAGWPEGFGPRGAVAPGFEVAPVFDVVAPVFDVVAAFFEVAAGFFGCGVADRATVRGADEAVDADDGPGDSDGAGGCDGTGVRAGCAGIPIAGASACTPIRLLAIATARIAPTTETGQPKPRSRRPRRPDWSTNTGAAAGTSKSGPDISNPVGYTDPRWLELAVGRTLRGLSLQGT
ncbi:hypothetical protein [Streptomyces yangpuensis]|uniref:hypothetical protein n=1 Tax=Streptomyces yangpuensis TaxID=1648182 RepID=UPI000ADCD526|nr:hypothetical protein [Streptomyces yangpuensis]